MKRAPYVCVYPCVCPSVRQRKMADFNSVCFIWYENFYTEFWNSLIMQIYFIKINEKCYSLSFLGRFWFCLFYLIGLGAGFNFTQNFEINELCKFIQNLHRIIFMQIYANLFKIEKYIQKWSALEAGTYITHRVIYNLFY